MSRTGIVNYHVHHHERQAFHIDAGGEQGKLISPTLVTTEVRVGDLREAGLSVTFSEDSVAFVDCPTSIRSFREGQERWKSLYDEELKQLLVVQLGVREVVVFDHTVRIDDPNAERRPARNVHSDYSTQGARQRLVDILGRERADEWSSGHYAFVNVWRPLEAPINSAPLGFVRPSSVPAEDWVLIDLVYPDRMGSIMGLVANDEHEWVYLSKMTPDEVAYFNIYDNRGLPSIGHSAIDLTEDDTMTSIRTSIESRTLIRY